ncbi:MULTISPECIES: sigma-70 family RNA polymerase sigma factor [Catenuloplanes]|uniref:RNA polymerase sigma factor for flagellar operon FliA n=1 Tax=Catenuloplanes niger TaxID=587534 RepID=A0AAE3ZMX5_9ACTN|nr:sigma-70 family RNA polymerase sigma factor [Catenuloplanes niger]MDR7322171.1 RNA polymerase sigma factor for flagellar operon FliA [Catenuloplanes niger]
MSSTTTIAPAPMSDRDREDLIRANMALVGHLVREMLGRVPAHVNRDDLTSAGLAALVTAARGFDPERGIPFHRFAATRIRGALLDELRGLDWASRSVRHRARQTDVARQALTAMLGRTPTAYELAEHLGIAVSEITSVEDDVQRAVVLSLQGFTTGSAEDMVTEPTMGPEEMLVHREKIGYLHHAVEALPERLRVVITRYFLHDEPMAVIAAELGVTESRISQLRAEALVLLRDGLNSHLDPDQVKNNGRPDGCVARRRAGYFAQIAGKGTLSSRLALTNHHGLPVQRVA